MAGLGAGETFRTSGVDFCILEGSNRAGGRVDNAAMKTSAQHHQSANDQIFVDSGAQWLHGRDNDVYKLAHKFNLIHDQMSEEAQGDYIRDDGVHIDEYFVKKIDFKFGEILEECEKFAQGRSEEGCQPPSSLKEFVEEKFAEFVQSLNTNEEKEQAMQLLDWNVKFVSC